MFLLFTISHNFIKPILKHSVGLKNFVTPKNKRDVHKFLGCINYDRNFIKKLFEEAEVLYELRGDKRFNG